MSKFGREKRYAAVLTVLLVIVIIGIVGLLGYFGYKAITRNKVENDAADATQQFYNNIGSSSDDEEEENTNTNYEGVGLENFNTTTPDSDSNSSSSTSGRKRTYLGDYEVKGTIRIPKTGIEYPILEKATVGSLAMSVGILTIVTCDSITTPVEELNVLGTNAFILGHNYRNGQFFSDNDQLEIGDEILVTDYTGQTITYNIYNMYYTTSDDVTFLDRELDPNTREITLQTCNDDSSQRLIIWARDN